MGEEPPPPHAHTQACTEQLSGEFHDVISTPFVSLNASCVRSLAMPLFPHLFNGFIVSGKEGSWHPPPSSESLVQRQQCCLSLLAACLGCEVRDQMSVQSLLPNLPCKVETPQQAPPGLETSGRDPESRGAFSSCLGCGHGTVQAGSVFPEGLHTPLPQWLE